MLHQYSRSRPAGAVSETHINENQQTLITAIRLTLQIGRQRQLAKTISFGESRMVPVPPNSVGQAFSRGIRLKCPICSGGKLYSGFIRMHRTCSTCGFEFERAPGYFLGSTYINYGVTTLLTTWTYMVLRFGFEVPKSLLIPALATFCVIFPVVCIFLKGLILAQNERWRRGLGMQVERDSNMGAANGVVMRRNVPSGRG
jgi:uncharacterized protein (DUF983 family)